MNERFQHLARACAYYTGTAYVFGLSVISIIVWLVSGPLFSWSDTWQLVVNTATTVITFLMVFLIQATQNRETKAIHAKLDRLLLRDPHDEDNVLIRIENETEEKIEKARDNEVDEGA